MKKRIGEVPGHAEEMKKILERYMAMLRK